MKRFWDENFGTIFKLLKRIREGGGKLPEVKPETFDEFIYFLKEFKCTYLEINGTINPYETPTKTLSYGMVGGFVYSATFISVSPDFVRIVFNETYETRWGSEKSLNAPHEAMFAQWVELSGIDDRIPQLKAAIPDLRVSVRLRQSEILDEAEVHKLRESGSKYNIPSPV